MSIEELKNRSANLSFVLSKLTEEDQVFAFLRDILSENEIIEFSRRLDVAKRLENKESYAKIEKETGMSSTTIARISKFLTGEFGGYRNALSILKSISDRHHTGHSPRDF